MHSNSRRQDELRDVFLKALCLINFRTSCGRVREVHATCWRILLVNCFKESVCCQLQDKNSRDISRGTWNSSRFCKFFVYGILSTISRGTLGSAELWLGNIAVISSPIYLLHFQKSDRFGRRGPHGCGN
jgi:hypothetical protein